MKIAVITGASSGIGREFARQISTSFRFLDEIWVIARREDRLESLRKECGIPLRIFSGTLIKNKIFKEYESALADFHPKVCMLVNAAGFGKSGNFSDIGKEDHKLQTKMIELNCLALTRMIQSTLPLMVRGGRILNIASAAAFCPQSGFAVYAATKAYVLSLSRALNKELRIRKICVTAVCPGPVDTEFFQISGTPSSLKKLTMVKAPAVVRKALRDSIRKKDVSVYGIPMLACRIAAKIIPHRMILKTESSYFLENIKDLIC